MLIKIISNFSIAAEVESVKKREKSFNLSNPKKNVQSYTIKEMLEIRMNENRE